MRIRRFIWCKIKSPVNAIENRERLEGISISIGKNNFGRVSVSNVSADDVQTILNIAI